MFKSFAEQFRIKLTDTTGYNPKANGIVERMHRDLAAGLQAVCLESDQSWEDALPQVLFALRPNVCSSTGLARLGAVGSGWGRRNMRLEIYEILSYQSQ